MKYATINNRKRIERVQDTEPAPREGRTFIELTDEQAAEFEAIKQAKSGRPIWFDGRVTTPRIEMDGGNYTLRWDEESGEIVKEAVLTAGGMPLAQAKAAYAATGAVFDAMPPGKQALWEPVRAKVAQAIDAGNPALAMEIITTVPFLYEGMEEDRSAFLALFGG